MYNVFTVHAHVTLSGLKLAISTINYYKTTTILIKFINQITNYMYKQMMKDIHLPK